MADKPRFVGERKQTKLGELCKPKQWKSLKQSDMTEAGYPVYGANGIIGFYHEYNHPNETILVGCRGTCGEVSICRPESYVTSNAMCLDNLADCIDMGYLACFLKAYDFRKIIGGTSQPQITKTSISSIDVPVYPLDVQLAIRSKLEAVLNQVDCCRKTEEHLNALVKSRFVEMFGDGCYPWCSLSSLSTAMQNGLSPSKAGASYARVLTLSALTRGGFDESAWKKGAFKEEPPLDKRVTGGRFYVCRGNGNRDLVGAAEFAPRSMRDLVFPDTMIEVRVNREKALPAYLAIAWRQRFAREQIERFAKTTNGTYKINQKALGAIEVPVPPLSLQQQFADFVARVDKSRFVVLNEKISRIQHISRRIAHGYSR